MMVKLKVLADKYGKNPSDLKKKLLQSELCKKEDFGKVDRALALPKNILDNAEEILLKGNYFSPAPTLFPKEKDIKVSPKKIKPRYEKKIEIIKETIPVVVETKHFGDVLAETAIDIFGIMDIYDAKMDKLRKENGCLMLQLNQAMNDTNQVDVNSLIEFVLERAEANHDVSYELLAKMYDDLRKSYIQSELSLRKALSFDVDKNRIELIELNYKYKMEELENNLTQKHKKIIDKIVQRFLSQINELKSDKINLISQHKTAKDSLIADLNQKMSEKLSELKSANDKTKSDMDKTIAELEGIVSDMKSDSQKDYLILMSDIYQKMNSKNVSFALLLFSISAIEGYLTGFLLGNGNMAIARGIAITTVGFFLSVYNRVEKGIQSDRKVRKLRLMSESEMLAYYRFGTEDLKRIEVGASRSGILIRKREEAISDLLNQKMFSDFNSVFSVVNLFSIAITVFSVVSMFTKFDVDIYMSVGVGFLILVFSKMSLHNIK